MRKIKKKTIFAIALIIGLVVFIRWYSNPERRIFAMVEGNLPKYQTVAEQLWNGEVSADEVDLLGVRDVRVRAGEHKKVDFFVTGFGLAPSSTYYGFYYSQEDLALPYLEETAKISEVEEGVWSWKGNGDNKGVTKKIADCWYYYEASF